MSSQNIKVKLEKELSKKFEKQNKQLKKYNEHKKKAQKKLRVKCNVVSWNQLDLKIYKAELALEAQQYKKEERAVRADLLESLVKAGYLKIDSKLSNWYYMKYRTPIPFYPY